ncbi:MAG: carbon starvation CstA family protein [Planctomycetota bacterium]|jgi:carbon starvation protein CstA
MEALGLALVVGVCLICAYFSYGRWIARRVFKLREDAITPAVEFDDNCDYCPTKKSVVFGHHFTSIAGTGPIVGPAIAVMWGWLPAIIWVLVGSIFIGAVHDLGSLVVSLRNKGRTIGDIAGDLLGPRVRLIFLAVLVMALWVVLAIFGLVVAAVLRQYPMAITPVIIQIPLAIVIGTLIHKRGGSIVLPSIIALGLMYASVIWGDVGYLGVINGFLAAQPTWMWVVGLLAYSYVASVLPVWVLLQPRDYINALQLITALGLLVVGLVVAGLIGGIVESPDVAAGLAEATGEIERVPLEIVAPMVNWHPEGAPPMIPILFITIACGAISGFHCLVSSGTTSKQLAKETDAQAIGYGSMLTEGFLATLVILSCAAGIGLGVTNKQFMVVDSEDRIDQFQGDPAEFRMFESEEWTDPVLFETNLSEWTVTDNADDAEFENWLLIHVENKLKNELQGNLLNAMEEEAHPMVPDTMVPIDKSWVRFGNTLTTNQVYNPRNSYPVVFNVGVGGELAFADRYSSWGAAGALSAKVGAFVDGSANLIKSTGIPGSVAVALMGVLVASFAGTTMDTACRLQRYVIQELARTFLPRPPAQACRGCGYNLRGLGKDVPCPECGHGNEWRIDFGGHPEEPDAPALEDDAIEKSASVFNPFKWLATRHGATMFAVVTAALLAFIPAPGQDWSFANAGAGGLILWPLFGATNQLLGGMSFLVIGAWLIATKKPVWFIVVPAILMLVLPAWALVIQAFLGGENVESWWSAGNWILITISALTLALEAWLLVEVVARMTARKQTVASGG